MIGMERKMEMKSRYLKYDVIRLTAVCLVLITHISAYLVIHFPEPSGVGFRVGAAVDCTASVCIPLFLMLSGALLLDEKTSFDVRHFSSKNYVAIVKSLLFWLVFYAAWRGIFLPVLKGNQPDIKVFARYFLKLDGDFPHLWYLFMLIGVYPAIPVLRLFVKEENRRYILGILLFAVIVLFIPTTLGVLTWNSDYTIEKFMNKFKVNYITGYIIFLLTGWYLAVFPLTGRKKSLLFAAGAAALCANILLVEKYMARIPTIMNYTLSDESITMLLGSAALFMLLLSVCGDRLTESRMLRFLSDAAFGIYITHVMVLETLAELVLPFEAFHKRFPILYILTLFAITFTASLGIVMLLSRFRFMRKLLHYSH